MRIDGKSCSLWYLRNSVLRNCFFFILFFIGYIGGYGKSSMFDVEWEKLGINEKMAHYVRNQMIRNHRGWATDNFSPFLIILIVFEFKRQDQPYNMTTSSWKLFFIENPICLMQPKLLIWIWIHEETQKIAENIRWKNWT